MFSFAFPVAIKIPIRKVWYLVRHPGRVLPSPGTATLGTSDTSLIPRLVRSVSVDFQDSFSQYILLAGEKHKRMRIELEAQSPTADIQVLKKYKDDLVDHLNIEFSYACQRCIARLGEYFVARSSVQPRFCIKIQAEGNVSDFYRDGPPPSANLVTLPAKENAAFVHCLDHRDAFLCNDIPLAIYESWYWNKRIARECAIRYVSNSAHNGHDAAHDGNHTLIGDTEWDRCWDLDLPSDERPSPLTHYKSTLVIPLSLARAELKQEVRQMFLAAEPIESLTFGFLCLDHRETEYFDKENDENIGYFVANLLSLYMMAQAMYTKNSKIFMRAVDELARHDFS